MQCYDDESAVFFKIIFKHNFSVFPPTRHQLWSYADTFTLIINEKVISVTLHVSYYLGAEAIIVTKLYRERDPFHLIWVSGDKEGVF